MKTILIILTLFTCSLCQFVNAQSLSNFYNVPNKIYTNTTKATSQTIKLETISDETIDIKFKMTVPKGNETGTAFNIKLGNNETMEFDIPFGGAHQETASSNGEQIEYLVYLRMDYNEMEQETSETIAYFTLRVAKNNVRTILYGEMSSSILSEKYPIDSRDITINMIGKSAAKLEVSVDIEYLHSLSCFSDNGLKIRQDADLNSKQIGSIPFGKKAYILEGLDKEYLYDAWETETKGDLKVGDVSSRMIKVLYDDNIGYAYGGFLMPYTQITDKDKNEISINGWKTHFSTADEVYHNKALALKKAHFDFEDIHHGNMDVSQRKLLLTKLFPQAFTMDKLNELCQANKSKMIEVKQGNYTENYDLTITDNQLVSVDYKKTRNGFLEEIASHSNAYVTASQLNMRSSINPKSDIITKIPIGKKVTILDSQSDFMVIGGLRGKMIKIKYNNQEGYVFDAYLAPVPLAPKVSTSVYKLTESFNKIVVERGFDQWEYRDGNNYEWSSRWMIVPSRDKFQALKVLRQLYPAINDLKFTWNEAKKDYDISSPQNILAVDKYNNKWFISHSEENGDLIISVETIEDNLQKITIFFQELGC